MKKTRVDFNFDWTYGVELKKLKEDLDELEKLGVTEIEIDAVDNYGSPSITIDAYIIRTETDEEYNNRINMEIRQQEELKRKELEILGKLILKYPEYAVKG